MNEKRTCLSGAGVTDLHVLLLSTVRVTAICLLAVALAGLSGCGHPEPVQKLAAPGVVESPQPKPTVTPDPVRPAPPAEPQALEGSGITVWAKEFPGQFIEGLDGNSV